MDDTKNKRMNNMDDIFWDKEAVDVRDWEVYILNKHIKSRDDLIGRLYASRSWKVTTFPRFIADTYRNFIKNLRFVKSRTKFWSIYFYNIVFNAHGPRLKLSGLLHELKTNLEKRKLFFQYQNWIHNFEGITKVNDKEIINQIDALEKKPLISIILPVFKPRPRLLAEAIQSIKDQSYSNWELLIVIKVSDNSVVIKTLEAQQQSDARIKISYDSVLDSVTGEFVAILNHEDLLFKHTLFCVAKEINQYPDVGIIYSDEDRIDEFGLRNKPYFKNAFNYELFLAQNMVANFSVYRTELIRKLAKFDLDTAFTHNYNLVLHLIEQLQAKQIIHIPHVLYHKRILAGFTIFVVDEEVSHVATDRAAVQAHLDRTQKFAEVIAAPQMPMYNRVIFQRSEVEPLVSIIILTRDKKELLEACIDSITRFTTYKNYEIIVIDNGSVEPCSFELFELLRKQNIKVVTNNCDFNFSALNNFAVKEANGEILCLLNNDIEIISPDWLEEMVSFATQSDVGCVGARLWYPNGQLQHGGIILGVGHNLSEHANKFISKEETGYFGRAVLHQSFSAVTAACLVIRREVFEEVGGMEERLAVAFNDIDFCLQVQKAGYRNVWTPYAEMLHHESVSRGHDIVLDKQARFFKEMHFMLSRWGTDLLQDPTYSPNLADDFASWQIKS